MNCRPLDYWSGALPLHHNDSVKSFMLIIYIYIEIHRSIFHVDFRCYYKIRDIHVLAKNIQDSKMAQFFGTSFFQKKLITSPNEIAFTNIYKKKSCKQTKIDFSYKYNK